MIPETNQIYCGDCLEVMREWPENCLDAIVTDPPAGISFMGKEWDTFDKTMFGRKGQEGENALKVKKNFEILPRYGNADLQGFQDFICAVFVEAIRVLKPGGHAFVWAIPRTSHHTAMGLERAGFEIRDCVYHVFGSGFPKSLDVSKAIDKAAGAEREVVGEKSDPRYQSKSTKGYREYRKSITGEDDTAAGNLGVYAPGQIKETAPSTRDAQRWSGWGTALKPAVECWWLCRKPLSEKTVAENVLKWGTGGLNIDACRVDFTDEADKGDPNRFKTAWSGIGSNEGWQREAHKNYKPIPIGSKGGRFPANLVHDGSDEVLAEFAKAGESRSSGGQASLGAFRKGDIFGKGKDIREKRDPGFGDFGSAARFFYCAKASRAERDAGLDEIRTLFDRREGMEKKKKGYGGAERGMNSNQFRPDGSERHSITARNSHPTVKPVALMRYLIRLIAPPGGVVLDMFEGSGSALVAAKEEGVAFVGVEISPEYCEIARRRVDGIGIMEPQISRVTRTKSQMRSSVKSAESAVKGVSNGNG